MLSPWRRALALLASTGTCIAVVPALTAAPAAAVTRSAVTVVATGLDNPRGISVAGDGSVYVAESGNGGTGPCLTGGEQDEVCLGASGAVTRIDPVTHTLKRIATGLPSLAGSDGSAAVGPSDVSVAPDGSLRVTIGLGSEPSNRTQLGSGGALLGHLIKVSVPGGTVTDLADVSAYEQAHDPVPAVDPQTHQPGPPDSNPNGVLAQNGRSLVADAGGNDVLSVDEATGTVGLVATFPDRMVDAPPFLGLPPGTQIPMEAVPTAITPGPDPNTVYVTQLTGFPFPVGGANVYKVDTTAQPSAAATAVAEGFTNIADAVWRGPDLFVLEYAHNSLTADNPYGALVRVRPDGTRQTLLQDRLFFPGGLALAPDGSLYITNNGILPGAGEVLRIDPSKAGDPAIQAACPPDQTGGPAFTDIAESVHEEAIACLNWWKIANGIGNNAFGPELNVSRGQMASFVARLIRDTTASLPAGSNAFTDDNGSVYEADINALAAAGIVRGATATTFRPNGNISRAEVAALAVRAYEYVAGGQLAAAPDSFKDDDGSVLEGSINKAAAQGWVNGYSSTVFGPDRPITRAESASVLARMLSTAVAAHLATLPTAT